jgi:hypothetical protein
MIAAIAAASSFSFSEKKTLSFVAFECEEP